MKRHLLTFVICTVAAAGLTGQTRRAFEVASVRASADTGPAVGAGVQITQRQVRFSGLSLRDYIGIAYSVRARQVEGPDWMAGARFEISATLPEGSKSDDLDEMLQTLLLDRFQLKAHLDKREFPVYGLEIAPDGVKLVKAADEPAAAADAPVAVAGAGSAQGIAVSMGDGSAYAFGNNKLEIKKLTMPALAETLTMFVDRPVVDMTKTAGRYDGTFEVTPEDYQGMLIRSAVNNGIVLPAPALRMLDTASIASLVDALRRAGLTLESRRAPLDVVIVDSVSRTPTEN
jgi:uncharacterized protein (TIGR03435 family)